MAKRNRRIPALLAAALLAASLGVGAARAQEGEPERQRIPLTVNDVLAAQARGQAPSAPREIDVNERLRAMSGAVRFSQDYLLGPGDVLRVTVYGIEALKEREVALDAEGAITLPFVGSVALSGLTAREAEVKLAALYEATTVRDPQVQVGVKEYRSQFVNVLGAVGKPGIYQLTRRVFLVDALTMAGGLVSEKYEPKAYIHRAESGDAAGVPETLEIDLTELLEKGDVRLNVPVYAGDTVSVPERLERFFYVLGDVNRGGAFAIKRKEEITLTKALASAGGLMMTAKSGKSYVIRQGASGGTEQIKVNVGKVLKGEMPDMVLADSDVVFIPGSTTKTIGKGVMGSISSVVSALTYVAIRGY